MSNQETIPDKNTDSLGGQHNTVVSIFHNAYTAWVILAISLALTITAWFIAKTMDNEKIANDFKHRTHEIKKAIEDRMGLYEQVLWSGVAFMQSAKNVNREDYANFVGRLDLEVHLPGIQGMGYAIPVASKDKMAHEKLIQSEGFPNFKIKPEGDREEYSSIIYLEPFDWRNKRAFGYDMWSNDMRREAMTRARDHGVAATSGIITLVQETEKNVQKGFLTYTPLYTKGKPLTTVEERREAFMGWVYAAFRAGDLMKGVLGSSDVNLDFTVFDGYETTEKSKLFSSTVSVHSNSQQSHSQIVHEEKLELQGRHWLIKFKSKDIHLVESKLPNIIVIAGFVIDFLLFYVIYSIYFLQKRAEKIASGMTEKVYEQLEEISQQRIDLANKNEELENFAYRTSHDLKAPLSTIKGFTKLATISNMEGDTDDTADILDKISRSAEKLNILIMDILNLSRASLKDEQTTEIDFNHIQAMMSDSLDYYLKMRPVNVFNNYIHGAPLYAQKTRVQQVIDNIVSNSIKYSDQNKDGPKVTISTRNISEDRFEIKIEDNGLGIPDKFKDKMFSMFYRVHPEVAEGSGLGLYIVKRHVEKMNGSIALDSVEGQGTTFTITLPNNVKL